MIIANTSLWNNTSKSSIRDFTILKHFKVNIHHPKAPVIKEVIWNPPLQHWTKCNTNEISNGNPDISPCGSIFRDHEANFLSCFVEPFSITSSYTAEHCGAMRAIELAYQRNWRSLWLETNSALVVLAFKTSNQIPWPLRNIWNNVKILLVQMNFMISHIYMEGNQIVNLIICICK